MPPAIVWLRTSLSIDEDEEIPMILSTLDHSQILSNAPERSSDLLVQKAQNLQLNENEFISEKSIEILHGFRGIFDKLQNEFALHENSGSDQELDIEPMPLKSGHGGISNPDLFTPFLPLTMLTMATRTPRTQITRMLTGLALVQDHLSRDHSEQIADRVELAIMNK
ncbi:hypothetical protein PRIPAC_90578 [Pristionchus pacificus]|uniref:Uncharacterized protein n=1 Tax=Pristionchus pacificus TaxID=54126 RepID=A0A2A6CX46_PRIPA|nr:hypothetical protein PRIPAC_90578 [Pristionchus pacificus]|eukprot:PDM82601.1 hypothetical protein PRIPAC_36994 [Pristionchus pacificus]